MFESSVYKKSKIIYLDYVISTYFSLQNFRFKDPQ